MIGGIAINAIQMFIIKSLPATLSLVNAYAAAMSKITRINPTKIPTIHFKILMTFPLMLSRADQAPFCWTIGIVA